MTSTCSTLPCTVKADALAAVTSEDANATSAVVTAILPQRKSADPVTTRPPSTPAYPTTLDTHVGVY